MKNNHGIGFANARFAICKLIQHSGFLEYYDQINVALVDTVFRSASKQAPVNYIRHTVLKTEEMWREVKTREKHLQTSAAAFAFVPSEPLKGLTEVMLEGVEYPTNHPFLDSDKLEKLSLRAIPEIVNLMSHLGNYKRLSRLHINADTQMADLLPLAECASLVQVDLSSCSNLADISALERCPTLTSLNLSHCYKIRALPRCRTMTNLCLDYCRAISDISALDEYNLLSKLTIRGCDQITDISFLLHCPNLRSLHIESQSIIKMKPIGQCSKLTKLSIYNFRKSKKRMCISVLKNCTALRHLNLSAEPKLKGTSVLGKLPLLSEIYISPNTRQIGNCKSLVKANICLSKSKCKTLAGIQKCHTLENLELSESKFMSDISALGKCKSLTKLDINNFKELKSTLSLNKSTTLCKLYLSGCPKMQQTHIPHSCKTLHIYNFDKLKYLLAPSRHNQLSHVSLSYCDNLIDISALAGCTFLGGIRIFKCPKLVDISVLGLCPVLSKVDIHGCNGIFDISALSKCTHLSHVTIVNCEQLADTMVHPGVSQSHVTGATWQS